MESDAIIYVAGHTGLVGSAILKSLQKQGFSHIITKSSSELDLRNQQEVTNFFHETKPEYVFLAAAKVGGIYANAHYPADFISDNLAIALNIINASYTYKVKKLVNLGSSCIYPKYCPQPIKEEYLLTGALEPTNEPYALAKIAAISLCTSFHKQYHCNFISLMPTNLYGNQDSFGFHNSHVLPALIRKFILAKMLQDNDYASVKKDLLLSNDIPHDMNHDEIDIFLTNLGIQKNSISLWGSGNACREFLHADDCADAAVYFMNNIDAEQAGICINIGTGIDCSIKDLAELIAKKIDYKGHILFDKNKPDGTPKKLLSVHKAISLGWQSAISLEKGIESVIMHYQYSVHHHLPLRY